MSLTTRRTNIFFVKSRGSLPPCPKCGGNLHYRDSRPRIRKKDGGEKQRLMIRRLRCSNCKSLHNELPDCLVPYKHYESEVISGVIDGDIDPKDDMNEDYPCEETMKRWIRWFQRNKNNLEGLLQNAARLVLDYKDQSLLYHESLLISIRNKYNNCWLEIILRIIYNSGGFLVPCR